MSGAAQSDRTILRVAGADTRDFLQGLVTNRLPDATSPITYAALLNPQGKYLADFFLIADADDILIDCHGALATGLAQRLGLYRLRAKVTIEMTELHASRGLGPAPKGALTDPRHPALGWRHYGPPPGTEPGAEPHSDPATDWAALRVEHLVPESLIELIPDDSYILEMGFERLHGVDFRKGCYVGQEVTARMKHKTELRKGLARVAIDGSATPGTPILTADGKTAGTLFTRSGQRALAYLRFDRANGPLTAGSAKVTLDP
ncbi:MAG: folate-binding protein [Paracoccaceae bacterium]